jgi:hypothetical protein
MLKERLRQALIDQAQTGNPTTYKELADRLGLEPPLVQNSWILLKNSKIGIARKANQMMK